MTTRIREKFPQEYFRKRTRIMATSIKGKFLTKTKLKKDGRLEKYTSHIRIWFDPEHKQICQNGMKVY